LKGPWIAVKRRFGLRGAIEMFPRLSGHGSAGDLAQIAETHLFEWFFGHTTFGSRVQKFKVQVGRGH
jgi:hypothetical protein